MLCPGPRQLMAPGLEPGDEEGLLALCRGHGKPPSGLHPWRSLMIV